MTDDAPGFLLPRAPVPKGASPIGNLVCPLGPEMSPHLMTPHWAPETMSCDGNRGNQNDSGPGLLGGLSGIDKWAWEVGSDAGSIPSAWSKPSTVHSSVSRLSSATGDGLIPGLIDGQRLSTVKPTSVSAEGGKVVVSLRKEVPQGHWDKLEVVLVMGPIQRRLTPTGIKKGKKLCIQIPGGMEPGDYDVRLSFAGKIIHGAIPLAIRDGDVGSEEEDD